MFEHTGIGLTEHGLIKTFTETLGSLGHLFFDFIVNLRNLLLNQHIGTIALLRVLIVNQRVVESVHVPRCLPDCRMHEDCGVYTHDVLVEKRH